MNLILRNLEFFFSILNVKWRIAIVISAVLSAVISSFIYVSTSFPEIVIFLLAMLMWIALSFVSAKFICSVHNRICQYEVDASVLNVRTERVNSFGENSQLYFEYISVEYEFNSRKYNRVIRSSRFYDVHSGQKIKLKICERYPGIYRVDKIMYKSKK